MEVLPKSSTTSHRKKWSKVLDSQQSLRRIQHAMTKIEDRIWALGGRDSNNNTPSTIVEFNQTTNSWNEIPQQLHSSNTSQLVVTEFPTSAIDCVPECSCGIANKKGRIFGGSEAEVRNIPSQLKALFSRQALTPGLLQFCGMKTPKRAISTARVRRCW